MVKTGSLCSVPGQRAKIPLALRHLLLGRKVMINLNSVLKTRDITLLTKFGNKGPYSQSFGFSSSHVRMQKC